MAGREEKLSKMPAKHPGNIPAVLIGRQRDKICHFDKFFSLKRTINKVVLVEIYYHIELVIFVNSIFFNTKVLLKYLDNVVY